MIYSRSNLKSVEKPLIPPWAAEGSGCWATLQGEVLTFHCYFQNSLEYLKAAHVDKIEGSSF